MSNTQSVATTAPISDYAVVFNGHTYRIKRSVLATTDIVLSAPSCGASGVRWYDYEQTANECPDLVAANPRVHARVVLSDDLPGRFALRTMNNAPIHLGDLHAYTKIGHPIQWTMFDQD